MKVKKRSLSKHDAFSDLGFSMKSTLGASMIGGTQKYSQGSLQDFSVMGARKKVKGGDMRHLTDNFHTNSFLNNTHGNSDKV